MCSDGQIFIKIKNRPDEALARIIRVMERSLIGGYCNNWSHDVECLRDTGKSYKRYSF